MRNELKKIGLNENEIKVYLTLLSVGCATVSVLSYRCEMSRNTCRYVCSQLVEKKLIFSKREGNTFVFKPEPPEKIMFLLDQEERIIKEKKNTANQLIGKLKTIIDPNTPIPKVSFHSGIEGIKRVYEDNLKDGYDIYAFENVEPMTSEVKDYVFNDYIPMRTKKNIFVKVITPKNKDHIITRKDDAKFMRETRYFNGNIIPIEIEINIYGSKTAFFSYKKDEMFAVILESNSVANSLKSIFDFCWQFSS